MSLKVSLAKPDMFSGNALVVPYLQLLNQHVIDEKMGILKFIDRFYPSFRVPIPLKELKAVNKNKFLSTINSDPLLEAKKIAVRNLIVNDSSLKNFHSREAENVKTPFIMILGGRDQIVHNKASKEFFDVSSSKLTDKDIVTYEDGDHFMLLDNEFSPLIVKDLIGWFNTHI